MTRHELVVDPATVTDVFSRDVPPVLEVDPGDVVVVHTLDCAGNLEPHTAPGVVSRALLPQRRGHCLCGPIAVRGADPGTALSVHLRDLRPGTWGWTVAAARDTWLNRRLGVATEPVRDTLWDLDVDQGVGTDHAGFSVDLRPFLGVIGLAPAEPGEHSTVPPRREGGNIDCRELVAGSTLYLPVAVQGGLLSVGDGHAAQGDGEVSGTAIECAMTSELVLDVERHPVLPTAYATTPAGRITFGFDADLNEASAAALDAMLTWMELDLELDRPAALTLASVAVDLRVTQVANRTWGVHAVLPDRAVRRRGEVPPVRTGRRGTPAP